MSGAGAGPPILVTGATGQVGFELVRALSPVGTVIAPPRDVLDLTRPESIRDAVRRVRPGVIVNSAAYTAVDRAESDADACRAANAEGPAVLAEVAAACGAALVHYSTDYVFDGSKGAPYLETDAPNPLNVYGRAKLQGEQAIQDADGAYLILRTGWVYGARGRNFLRTILQLARDREELRVVNDQWGAPTSAGSIAAATAAIVGQLVRAPGGATAALADSRGIYHLTAAGATTWWEFAKAILVGAPAASGRRCTRVIPVPTREYPTAARRPAYSVLDGGRLQERFGLRLPDWRRQLALVLAEINAAEGAAAPRVAI